MMLPVLGVVMSLAMLLFVRIYDCHPGRGSCQRSWMVGEGDLGKGELPTLRPLVPDVGEARLLLEWLPVVGASQIDPAAEDDRVAEIPDEGRFDRVGIGISMRIADQRNQAGFVGDLAARAEENVVVGDQFFELCVVALAFLGPIVALRGACE